LPTDHYIVALAYGLHRSFIGMVLERILASQGTGLLSSTRHQFFSQEFKMGGGYGQVWGLLTCAKSKFTLKNKMIHIVRGVSFLNWVCDLYCTSAILMATCETGRQSVNRVKRLRALTPMNFMVYYYFSCNKS